MKRVKSFLAIILCLTMLLPTLPMSVFAVNSTTEIAFEGYIPISTKDDLNNIRNDLFGKYYLTQDIEFEVKDFEKGGAFYNNGQGWLPIGSDSSNPFKGVIEGNNHYIKGLVINISGYNVVYAGLLGYNEGVVQNVGMCDGSIGISATPIPSSSIAYIGGIAGANYGNISNCFNTNHIIANSSTENFKHKFAYVGGIVGVNYGTISKCYNTGSVIDKNCDPEVGGIVGVNYGAINNCYNTGDISAKCNAYSADVGGIAGCFYGYENGAIINCYNIGKISAIGYYTFVNIGGIAGICSRVMPSNCYYLDNVAKGVGTAYEVDEDYVNDFLINSCTDEEMKQESTYIGFDFVADWQMGQGDFQYPILRINSSNNSDSDIDDDLEQDTVSSAISYGADRLSFGDDIAGYVGDEIDTLVVYTTANENIASLNISSSNSSVVEIGTIKIGSGEYVTSENEHMATIPLKLKAEGTSTITITSPEGISTSVLVVVYPKEAESEETNQYIQEHTSFVNSNKYNNLTTNASFYNSIWKHEENSSNFTRYAAWDVIGRVGKFAALDFYGAFETENPYDVVLVDTFRSYVSNEKSKAAEVFETTTKNILGSPGVFNDVLDVLKTSEAWNSDLTQDWLQFTDNVQEDWIQGVFFTESTFNLDDYNPELYKVLKEVFSKTDKSGFEKVFKNIKNFGIITDYITSGGDVVFRFFDAYQKYLIAEALFETNEYVLASVEMIAEFQMTGENSELLLDALEPYWDACDYDSAFSSVCSIMLKDGLLGSTGNVAYTLLGKELLRDFVYAAIHKVTGLSLGALVATYNLTYICLDYLSGLGDLTETHRLMNAAALLEKEYIELAKDKAETLVSEKTHQAAAEFDTVWGFLQSLEGYCYKTMSTYVSAFKREYTTNYIIETAITKNPFFAVIDGIKLSEDLSSCDSAIQAVVYLESEWVNANCHKGIYSSSNLMTVKCPTDVYVYDSENNLVLSIIDNKVTFCADHITAFVDGDEKIFVLPTNQEYNVQIIATDNGTMDYAVKSFDEIALLRTIRYDDVELVNGTDYVADIPSELYVEKENYNLKTEAGVQIEADYDSLAPKNETLSDISGIITSYGNGNNSVIIRLLQDTNEIDSVQTTDNSFIFKDVTVGTYTLEVSKANHATRTYEITVTDEDVVQNVKIHLLGDINGDGLLNIMDVNRANAHAKKRSALTEYDFACADINGDGAINIMDVNRMNAHAKKRALLW